MLWHVVKVDRPDWDYPMLAASLECDKFYWAGSFKLDMSSPA